jgi:hypothetical protein
LATHGVDIREAVRRGDGAVVVGVVHDRREEIRRDHEGTLLVQAPDSRVVRIPQPHQQVREGCRIEDLFHGTQNLRQRLSA